MAPQQQPPEGYRPWRPALNLYIRDTPGWTVKFPLGPARFDVKCVRHNRVFPELTPAQLPSNLAEFKTTITCCSWD